MKTKFKPNIFIANHELAMRNGSCYRITGRKREFAARYINGDFVHFVMEGEIPTDKPLILPWKEAKKLLPSCFNRA